MHEVVRHATPEALHLKATGAVCPTMPAEEVASRHVPTPGLQLPPPPPPPPNNPMLQAVARPLDKAVEEAAIDLAQTAAPEVPSDLTERTITVGLEALGTLTTVASTVCGAKMNPGHHPGGAII